MKELNKIKWLLIMIVLMSIMLVSCHKKKTKKVEKKFVELSEGIEERVENQSEDMVLSKINGFKIEIIQLGEKADQVKDIDDATEFLAQFAKVIFKFKTFRYRFLESASISEEAQAAIDNLEDEDYLMAMKKINNVFETYRGNEKFDLFEEELMEKYSNGESGQ